jgi:cobalt-zinc-cadmium efflux system outer membrane protein
VFGNHLVRMVIFASASLLSTAQAATLREALDHAWAAQANQLSARDQQFSAQVAASQAWTPAPASVGLFNTSDQLNDNYGRREWEVEVSTPIWLPGQRDQVEALANAEKTAFSGRSAVNRWQLAGQLRESWWAQRLAQLELRSAAEQLEAAQVLAKDVGQRVKAGELAALDDNLAQSRIQQAKGQHSLAQLQLHRAAQAFALLSRGAALPEHSELLATPPARELHPLLSSLQDATRSAQARLEYATADTRDAPQVALSYTSERDGFDDPYRGRVKLGITVPFGTESRNQPRISAANADWIEAQTSRELASQGIDAELANARLELSQSRQQRALADAELSLAKQRAEWISKGFQLGQFDLPTQLRSQQEQLEAQAQVTRAEYGIGRAISRFNQAAGVLP